MNSIYVPRAISLLALVPMVLTAQMAREHDPVLLKNWPTPLYWQPTPVEHAALSPLAVATVNLPLGSNALVFVAMTPCRLVDTRTSQGFSGAFGPPSLVGNAPGRTFPIQSSTTCSISPIAQAYSFNVTVVPGNSVGFVTAYPAGPTQPLAATLVWQPNVVVSNAAIVAAGTSGSVDVYANANTDLVVDINGYYAPPGDLQGNTALGMGLQSNTTGSNNTASGLDALQNNTTGAYNTASGENALQSNTTGSYNTASGSVTLINNTTGSANTASGNSALYSNTTGNGNTASGGDALQNNTTGGGNTADGDEALQSNTTGSLNTASGFEALQNNTTGRNNIAIGYLAANNPSGGNSNNIHFGSQGAATDNNAIRVGTPGTQSSFFAAGVRGVTTGNSDAIPVVIDSNGQLGTVSSSRRFKEDIQDMGEASSGLLQLRPVAFRYQKAFDDGSKPIQYGLIAEEVEKIYPELVAHSADGQIETVKYQVLDSMLLNELQKQAEKIRQQTEQNRSLEDRLAVLESLLLKARP